jgi:DNA-binding transcriptional regulator YiaG
LAYLQYVTMHLSVTKPIPNQKLRAARMALRLSQNEFAIAIRHAGASLGEPNECTKRLVQKWESGEHSAIRPNYRRALQAVTRIPYEQLGFLGATSVPVAPVLESVTPPPYARSPAVRGLPQPGTEGDRLRYALTRPETADDDSVALLEAHTTQLFDLEHTRPSRLLAPQAAGHLDDIAAMLAGTRRISLRRQLAATGGRSAALAGWLAFDCGDIQGAHRWWDNALAAAEAATDGPLLACTLTYLSYSAADRGDPATAWQLANTALGHAGPHPRAKAWMAVRAAQEAATLGERHAAQVALDLALDLSVGLHGPDGLSVVAEQPWTSGFDLACLYAMVASTHGRLGDLRQARDAAARSLEAMKMPMRGDRLWSVRGAGAAGRAGGAGSVRDARDVRGAGGAGGAVGVGTAGTAGAGRAAGGAEDGGNRRGSGASDGHDSSEPPISPGSSAPSGPSGTSDLAGCVVPDQTRAQVKLRAVALAEVAYAAARVGEIELARSAGRLAAELAGRLEVSQARQRLRALAPLLAERRR